MRNAVAHDPSHGLFLRHVFLAALLFGVAIGTPAMKASAQETVQGATQPAASQPEPHRRGFVEQPRTRTPATSPSTQSAAPSATAQPAAPSPTTGGTPGASSAKPAPAFHAPDWLELFGVVLLFAILTSALIYAWKVSRDKALEKLAPDEEEPPFTLEELRQLRDSNQISQEEFLRARAIVLEKERRRMAAGNEGERDE